MYGVNREGVMIISEKIMSLRKLVWLSQEELANLADGYRGSPVSKWESAASMPDIQKIIWKRSVRSVGRSFV